MKCQGWPDQPCSWSACTDTGACQNHPAGSSGPDVSVFYSDGRPLLMEVCGAEIEAVEVPDA